MTLIPYKNEILVLPITAIQAVNRLSMATQPASLDLKLHNDDTFLFIGNINLESFRISRKISYPQNYLPLIKGQIEGSSRGCILFIKYRLFFSSRLFFYFWTFMTLLIGTFLVIMTEEYMYAALSYASSLANYTVTILNFRRQVKLSRTALCEALKIDR